MDELATFLNAKVQQYNQPAFIKDDPVCIPHLFSKRADIEIAGLFAAIFAWGNRTTIINKSNELLGLMNNQPHEFVLHHTDNDLKMLLQFKHRTFNTTDLLYFISFLRHHYQLSDTLETAFTKGMTAADQNTENALNAFHRYFFSLKDVPLRTQKHIAAPFRGSTCKRLNMYLRWMVRKDKSKVDLGLWKKITPAQLVCPIDVHVARVARSFGLLDRNVIDWQAAIELTEQLKKLDPIDPVKYDFALFGLGVAERF